MCTFIYHDLQLLVIDLSVIQIRTRLLLMTMIGTVLLIRLPVMCLYNNTQPTHQPN